MKKITIVGAGNVGTATARVLATRELARDIVLIDTKPGLAEGNALDIQESAALSQFDSRLTGGVDLAAMQGSDMVIITAGFPRRPGMSRSDVLGSNLPIIEHIIDGVKAHAPTAIVLMVTNPVDSLSYLAWQRLEQPRQRLLGLGGVLDTARMASFISLATGVSSKEISALVLGGHGDEMIPMARYSSVNGIPLESVLDAGTIHGIVERTRDAGREILELRGFSAFETPAAAIMTMVDAIGHDRKRILPCVAVLDGEYGQRQVAMGVPVQLGRDGVEKIFELELSGEERQQLQRSAQAIRADIDKVGR